MRTHILDAAQTLISRGHTVVVVSPDDGCSAAPVGWELIQCASKFTSNGGLFLSKAGLTIRFGGTQIDMTYLSSAERNKLHKLLISFNPDVIHFHTPWTPFLSLQLLHLSRMLKNDGVIKSRIIATFHDTPSDSRIGRFLGSYLMPFAARYMMRAFDRVIAVSRPQSMYLTRFTHQSVDIIPNGILVPEFDHKPSFEEVFGPFLLFLGRLEHRKGVFDAIKAYEVIYKSHPNVALVIAGDGPLMGDAQHYVTAKNLKSVHFPGSVSDQVKWNLMRDAMIFMSPARYGESFGIVLLEAMSVGTPTVGYANAGYKSVIQGVFDEYFPAPGDIHKLSSVLDELLKSESNRRDISEKAKKLGLSYNWNRLIDPILDVYQI